MLITWQIKHFSDLTVVEFHDIIQLRISVFVVEQKCIYQELDGKDKQSFHLFGIGDDGQLVAAARILPAGISYNEISIGRIVSSPLTRNKGLGHEIVNKSHSFILNELKSELKIRLSAQKHLEHFYNKHGYFSTGKEYLEDGIPHVEMLKH